MALSATLYIGDNLTEDYVSEYKVLSCRVKTARQHKSIVPDTDPACAEFDISLVAPDKYAMEFYDWYAKQDFQSGKIVMDLSDQAALYNETLRTIRFTDAKCHLISEEYDIDSRDRHILHLGMAVRKLEIEGAEFVSNFKY